MRTTSRHLTPEGLGALNVMKSALNDAGMKPEEVDYVNVHGTSTRWETSRKPRPFKASLGTTRTT